MSPRAKRSHRAYSRRARPLQIESLENRQLLSVVPTVNLGLTTDSSTVGLGGNTASVSPTSDVKTAVSTIGQSAREAIPQPAMNANAIDAVMPQYNAMREAAPSDEPSPTEGDPPVISDFTGRQVDGQMCSISGTVTDDDGDYSDIQLTFGGILAPYNISATVQADGTFSVAQNFPGIESGIASVQAFDPPEPSDPPDPNAPPGQYSNQAECMLCIVPMSIRLSGNSPVNEGDTFAGVGSVTDSATSWSGTADYGDGSGTQSLEFNSDATFALAHQYNDCGNFMVTVNVENSNGETSSAILPVTVNKIIPQVALAGNQMLNEGDAFVGSGSVADSATFCTATVNYGDNSGAQPLGLNSDKSFALNHVYTDGGSYNVTVGVQDSRGETGTATMTVAVSNVPPPVTLSGSSLVEQNDVFSGSGSFAGVGSSWTATVDYGDNSGVQPLGFTPYETFTLSHVYAAPGCYEITAQFQNGQGETSNAALPVTVNYIAPQVTLTGDSIVNEGDTFIGLGSFTDMAASWTATVDYGDNSGVQPLGLNPDKTFNLSHVYSDGGDYTITVNVQNNRGEMGTATLPAWVNNIYPQVVLSGCPSAVDDGSVFSVAGSFTGVGSSWTATADYGDNSGAQPLGLNPDNTFTLSHVYPNAGYYTVTVNVQNNQGQTGTATLLITVVTIRPQVYLAGSSMVNEGDTLSESGGVTDVASSWAGMVDYGDGSGTQSLSLSNDMTFSLSHVYSEHGTYTITVSVENDQGETGAATAAVVVNGVTPQVALQGTSQMNEGDTFSGSGSFTGVGSYWNGTVDYGDGSGPQPLPLNNDHTFSLSHVYSAGGNYTIAVSVENNQGETGTANLAVVVNSVTPQVALQGTNQLNEGDTFGGSGSFTGVGSCWNGAVDYGDGSDTQSLSLNYDNTFSLSHVYSDGGNYTITVNVQNNHCETGIATLAVVVTNFTPQVAMQGTTQMNEGDAFNGCGSFTDVAASWAGTVDYGDGSGTQSLSLNYDKTFSLSHVYSDGGNFTITVGVQNNQGEMGAALLGVTVNAT